MNYITTTNLRTQSSQLINALRNGISVSLIHRSQVVGIIKPMADEAKPFNVEEFRKLLKGIKPKRIIPRNQRDKIYRKHLEKKYGKSIS